MPTFQGLTEEILSKLADVLEEVSIEQEYLLKLIVALLVSLSWSLFPYLSLSLSWSSSALSLSAVVSMLSN